MTKPPWTLFCFGALQARSENGCVVERFRTQKTAALLALLALGKRPRRREELCLLLWPDAAPEAARNSLSAALSSLRRQFGDDTICADRLQISLAPDTFETDVARFNDALKAGDLACAADIYRGHLLPGFHEEPLLQSAREYEEKAQEVFSKLLLELEERGEYEETIRLAHRALTLFPDTPIWQLTRMRALRALERYDAALGVFKEIENYARREKELVPDAARQLARQIRRERENVPPTPPELAPVTRPVVQTEPTSIEVDIEADDNQALPDDAFDFAQAFDSLDYTEANSTGITPLTLPTTWTKFFGRETEIAELLALLLGGGKLITLSGMGGTGKTRLAIEIARRAAPTWTGEIHFVSLASLTDATLLFSAIRDALRLPVAPDLPPLEQIVTLLQNRPTLLILDNFEHLVENGAARIQELRAALPLVTFIITSRLLLHVPGEREWPVAPLPTPAEDPYGEGINLEECPSSALFLDRARAARSGLELTPQNIDCIAQLCRRLDGIPLALELAAARLRVLSPAQILERLEKQLDFLQSREHGIPERQRTLRATVEWSFELLSPGLQHCFSRLSVFRGGWSLEAVEHICAFYPGEEVHVLDNLDQLRLNSLLVTLDTPLGTRFRLLEVLREWGAAQLEGDEETTRILQKRHFEYYTQLMEDAADAASLAMRRTELAAEGDNFRAALAWALSRNDEDAANDATRLAGALCPWWESRSLFFEGREWALRVLRKPGEVAPRLRARLLCGAGSLLLASSDFIPAQSLLEEGLALQRALGDEHGVAFALSKLGVTMMFVGQNETALRYAEEGLALARGLNDPSLLVGSLLAAGWTYLNTSRYSEAIAHMEELQPMARAIGEKSLESLAYTTKGYALVFEKRFDEAGAICEEGLQIALDQATSNPWSLAFARAVNGIRARESGDLDKAFAFTPMALRQFHNIGTRWELASAFTDSAMLLVDTAQWEKAATFFGIADGLCKNTGYRMVSSIALFSASRQEKLRQMLDKETFKAHWMRGQSMSLEEAVALAGALQRPVSPTPISA